MMKLWLKHFWHNLTNWPNTFLSSICTPEEWADTIDYDMVDGPFLPWRAKAIRHKEDEGKWSDWNSNVDMLAIYRVGGGKVYPELSSIEKYGPDSVDWGKKGQPPGISGCIALYRYRERERKRNKKINIWG